jgi:hypothetical protein
MGRFVRVGARPTSGYDRSAAKDLTASRLWQVFYGLFDPVVGHVIGCRFGAQAQVIADILLTRLDGAFPNRRPNQRNFCTTLQSMIQSSFRWLPFSSLLRCADRRFAPWSGARSTSSRNTSRGNIMGILIWNLQRMHNMV